MDEQRILDEMERRLADDDPRLASRLASLGGTGLGAALRSPRGRLIASLAALALIAVIAVMMFAMLPFRAAARQPQPHRSAARPGVTQPVMTHPAGGTAAPKIPVSGTQ
jgi:predicted lipid-binding transport protein (Tim44 family)